MSKNRIEFPMDVQVGSVIVKIYKVRNKAYKSAAGVEAKAADLVKWKKNALRHSFISYRVAETQNVAQVALEAGNSTQIIFQHYRELVRLKEAKRWFGIEPDAGGKAVLVEVRTELKAVAA